MIERFVYKHFIQMDIDTSRLQTQVLSLIARYREDPIKTFKFNRVLQYCE